MCKVRAAASGSDGPIASGEVEVTDCQLRDTLDCNGIDPRSSVAGSGTEVDHHVAIDDCDKIISAVDEAV